MRTPLPETATDEELSQAAVKEILFLVVRDLTNVMPFLREHKENEQYIQLPYLDVAKIRKIAFLRGHIPYLTQALAARIGKEFWKTAKKRPHSVAEIFQGNIGNIHAYSCDWICSEFPECTHDDIYANGRAGGGRGFNRSDIFSIAEELGIVISGIPQHPLERAPINVNVGPDKPKRPMRNDLPVPPEEIKKITGTEYPIDHEFILKTRESKGGVLSDKTFSNILQRIKLDAREEIYRIQDQPANRYHMMKYIPWAITEGKTLREICQGINGTPTMLEISQWLQYYPDFRRELDNAEAIQAHTFMDQAQEIVMGLPADTDKLGLAVAKFQTNFLMKRAALQSEKFREKKVIQTENINEKNEIEIKRQLKTLLRGESIAEFIDVEILKQPTAMPEFEDQNAG